MILYQQRMINMVTKVQVATEENIKEKVIATV